MNMQVSNNKGFMTETAVAVLVMILAAGCSQSSKPIYKVGHGNSQWQPYPNAVGTYEGPHNQGVWSNSDQQGNAPPDWVPAHETMTPYHIGPGDQLEVKIFQLMELGQESVLPVTVDSAGRLYLPLLLHVPVAGLTSEQVRQELSRRLSQDFIRDPQVNVRVVAHNSKEVKVVGMVGRPGTVKLQSDSISLMDLINQTGGIQSSAGPTIEIWRAGGVSLPGFSSVPQAIQADYAANETTAIYRCEQVPVDLLFAQDGPPVNPIIFPGDTVKVDAGSQGYVYVSGEVKKAGSHPFRRPLTILQAVASAGGTTRIANEKKCTIIRRTPEGGEKAIRINLENISKGKEANLMIAQNDTIMIPIDPVKKFFDDVDRLITRGVRMGVDATYDASPDLGMETSTTE